MNQPLVSVIIVNYNGKTYVERCVPAVFENTYSNYEVIVVDNGSTDGSVASLRDTFTDKGLQVVPLDKNYGPAYARNKGIEIARGKYLAFLDNDTTPESDWLVEPVKAMEVDPTIGACQCKLLLMNERNRLDYVGDYLSPLGFLIQRVPGGAVDEGQADERVEILSAKSAAMVSRAAAVKSAGEFDEDYFIYVEETDLAWRMWLLGYRVVFIPESRVYHEFGTSAVILGSRQNFLVKYLGPRNYITTLIKNLEFGTLVKILPIHVTLWLLLGIWLILKRQVHDGFWVWQGVFRAFRDISPTWRKRKNIQATRIVRDNELLPKVMRSANLDYFVGKASRTEKVGNADGWRGIKHSSPLAK